MAKNTANLVLKRLRDLGYVHKPRGSNRYVLTSQNRGFSPEEIPGTARWAQIAKILEKKILQGYYKSQLQLPSLKEMQHEFGASYATVRKATDRLITKGLIHFRGKKLVIAEPIKQEKNMSRIYVYGNKNVYYDFYLSQALRQIEQTSLSLGWGRLGFQFSENKIDHLPRHLVGGYIVLNDLGGFLKRNFNRDIPLSVLDRGFENFNEFSQFKFCVRVRPDERQAGHKMGLYLNGLGHRHAAFFTHLPVNVSWVSQRMENLKTKFDTFDIYELKEIIKTLPPGLRTHSRRPLKHFFGSEYSKLISNNLIYKGYLKRSEEIVSLLKYAQVMNPLFEKALQNRQATVWICANDQLALAAIQFLRNGGIKVPDTISVTGFDNHSMAQIEELTTFDMQYDRMGFCLVNNFLLRPQLNNKRSIKIIGEVIPRKSSGPPPGLS